MPINSLDNAGIDGPSVGKHTIYDIARLAGVSGKTVSRVLNNEPSVSPATRDRVSRIIEELGYQPHHGARSMRGQQRDCVGVVFSAPMNKWPVSHQQINWLFFELERVFGASAEFWLRLQASHDLEVARRGSAKRIRAETTPLTANRPT